MQFKNFLLRVNRGIALAIVLIIGLSGFFVYDARRFSSEIYVIRELLAAYLVAAEEMNYFLSNHNCHLCPTSHDDAVCEAMTLHINEFTGRFLTQSNPRAGNWFRSRADVASTLHNLARFTNFEYLDIAEEVNFSLGGINTLRRQGTNAVFVQFIVRVEVTGYNRSQYFSVFESNSLWREARFFETDILIIEDEYELLTTSYETTVLAMLFKRGGEWRFAEINQWSSWRQAMPVTREVIQ